VERAGLIPCVGGRSSGLLLLGFT